MNRVGVGVVAVVVCLLWAASGAVAAPDGPVLVSLHSDDVTKGDADSGDDTVEARSISVSKDGHVVAFVSTATNLVAGDTNKVMDVFVRDLSLGTTERISVTTSGAQGNDVSHWPSVSADGRYVAFESYASNLVPGDANGKADVFVRDRTAHTTKLVSHAKGSTAPANDCSYAPSISPEGNYVAFQSFASDISGADTNPKSDVFVRNLVTDGIDIASLDENDKAATNENWNPSISQDGLRIAFASDAPLAAGDTNPPHGIADGRDVYVRDRLAGTTTLITKGSTRMSDYPVVSTDGKRLAFDSLMALGATDKNETWDVYQHDLGTGKTTLASVDDNETHGPESSDGASISGDGTRVAFASYNDYDGMSSVCGRQVYVRDLTAGTTRFVSGPVSGAHPGGCAADPAITRDGLLVAFSSRSANLVPLDHDSTADVYLSNGYRKR